VATFYAARSEIITPLPWLTFALPFSTVRSMFVSINLVETISLKNPAFGINHTPD
jgi:hypothetical protein